MSRSSLNIEYPSKKSESPITATAMYGTNGDSRDFGNVYPSRTAAMGGTRVARIAGKSPATSVMIVPTRSETTIVRVA